MGFYQGGSRGPWLRFGSQSEDVLVWHSQIMRPVVDDIHRVSQHDVPVLIQGETGTGKDIVARAIHLTSDRRCRPYVEVNCSAIPATLVESELFGHEKGSFTGAYRDRKGKFEQANHGTIFLNEIGDLPPDGQAKLLTILQNKMVTPVGASGATLLDFRVISATNQNLEEMVRGKSFRSDLLFRLDVFPISIPPLRDRRGDIEPLAHYFAQQYMRESGKPVNFTWEAIDALTLSSYDWPGNVRELQNTVIRAIIRSDDGVVLGDHVQINGNHQEVARASGQPHPNFHPSFKGAVVPLSAYRLGLLIGQDGDSRIRRAVSEGHVYTQPFGGESYYPEQVLYLTPEIMPLFFPYSSAESRGIERELESGRFNEIAKGPFLITNRRDFLDRSLGFSTQNMIRNAIRKHGAYEFDGARARFFVVRWDEIPDYVPRGAYRQKLIDQFQSVMMEEYKNFCARQPCKLHVMVAS